MRREVTVFSSIVSHQIRWRTSSALTFLVAGHSDRDIIEEEDGMGECELSKFRSCPLTRTCS